MTRSRRRSWKKSCGKNRLTLTDYLQQMEQLQNMGDLSQIASMLPGNIAKGFDPSQIDEKQMAHTKAIILSMTPLEREIPRFSMPPASGVLPPAAACRWWM